MTIRQTLYDIRDIVEVWLLFWIWVDGRAIRVLEKATHDLYVKYFKDRQDEREAKHEQLRKAREAKAAKKTEATSIP